jgi:hypothetical protein
MNKILTNNEINQFKNDGAIFLKGKFDIEFGRIVVWRRESLPHSTSYPLLMLILQNVLIKYTPFCTPKCSPYAGV